MSKVVYYVASTMDGYIATKEHTLGWLESYEISSDATPYEEFYQTIGALIMGSKTYEWILANSPNEWPYRDLPIFVISKKILEKPSCADITFVQDSATDLAEKAKKLADGKDVWVVGGGKTAAYFANSKELDQLFITTIPTFIGDGVSLLPVEKEIKTILRSYRPLKCGAIEYILDVTN